MFCKACKSEITETLCTNCSFDNNSSLDIYVLYKLIKKKLGKKVKDSNNLNNREKDCTSRDEANDNNKKDSNSKIIVLSICNKKEEFSFYNEQNEIIKKDTINEDILKSKKLLICIPFQYTEQEKEKIKNKYKDVCIGFIYEPIAHAISFMNRKNQSSFENFIVYNDTYYKISINNNYISISRSDSKEYKNSINRINSIDPYFKHSKETSIIKTCELEGSLIFYENLHKIYLNILLFNKINESDCRIEVNSEKSFKFKLKNKETIAFDVFLNMKKI